MASLIDPLESRRLLSATYQVIDLGTLGGTNSYAYDLNASGQVVGYSQIAGGTNRAFIFKDANSDGVADAGEMINLGALDQDLNSYAYGVNDAGVAVGTSISSTNVKRAVRYESGVATDLGMGNSSTAYGINAGGDIVGGAVVDLINYTAYLRSAAGAVTNLGSLNKAFYHYSEAASINASGAVAGWSGVSGGDSGFVALPGLAMTPAGFTDQPGGYRYNYAWDINAAGQAVGEGFNSDGAYHPFLYDGTSVRDLGLLDGFVSGMALGINTGGTVVGRLKISAGVTRAFIAAGGLMADLNTLIPAGSGLTLTEARSINDSGSIAATATTALGETHAVLLIPLAAPVAPKVAAGQFIYAANPNTVMVQFDTDISASLTAADLSVLDRTQNLPVTGITLAWDAATNTATFTLPRDLPNGDYRATIAAVDVADASFTTLDGDQSGAAGGDYKLDFFVLMGDADRDRSVNLNDLIRLANHYGATSDVTYSDGDFDLDGSVNLNDLIRLANNYGTTLVAPASSDSVATSAASPAVVEPDVTPVVEPEATVAPAVEAPVIEAVSIIPPTPYIESAQSPLAPLVTTPATDVAAETASSTDAEAPATEIANQATRSAQPARQSIRSSHAKLAIATLSKPALNVASTVRQKTPLIAASRKPIATTPATPVVWIVATAPQSILPANDSKQLKAQDGLLFSTRRVLA